MNKNNNLENQNKFCRNRHLEEIGASPLPDYGEIIFCEKIRNYIGEKTFYIIYIKREFEKFFFVYLHAKGFKEYPNENQLFTELKPGNKLIAHGDYVEVNGKILKDIRNISEIWVKILN